MIRATIKYSGTFIDRPNIKIIDIPDDDIAAEKPLPNGKTEKLTARQLFNIFWLKKSYNTEGGDPENEILPGHFELWFQKKYLENTNYYNKIINIEYTSL